MNHFATLTGSLLPRSIATAETTTATAGAESSSGGFWHGFANLVQANPILSLYILLAVLIVILYAVWRNRGSNRDFSVYQDEGGAAAVSTKALEHLIEIACESVGTAGKPRIALRQVKGLINVEVATRLYPNQRLGQVHEQLRRQIVQNCEQSHGIKIGDVSLKVIGFKKDYGQPQAEAETVEALPLHDEESESGVGAAAPEASAASLYEEPSEEAIAPEGAADANSADNAAPKKRRFGFFGRHSDAPEHGAEADTSHDKAEKSDWTGGDSNKNA